MFSLFLLLSGLVAIVTAHTPQEWESIFNNVKE